MITLQRGASNMYFANVATSILIPPYSGRLRAIVDEPKVWELLTAGLGSGESPSLERISIIAGLRRENPDALAEVVAEKIRELGEVASDEDDELSYRYDEYRALRTANTRADDDLLLSRRDLADYPESVRERFDQIVLVKKLTETRALTGFWRVKPPHGENVQQSGRRHLSIEPTHWLPAVQVRGEGIFFTLDRGFVSAWGDRMRRSGRWRLIHRIVDPVNHDRVVGTSESCPMLVLVHTLSHLLIRRLSFSCGYGTAALAERLYVSRDPWMCGALIYTAAGDAEGTLGGLVNQGRPEAFSRILEQALREAEWCSSDPVCRESSGQGVNSLNLAACHMCALLPETTCELGNRLLDRLTLVDKDQTNDGG